MSQPRWSLKMIFAPLAVKPWLVAVLAGFVAAGCAIGWFVFPPEWEGWLRLLFGALLGLGSTLSLFLPRMIATDYDT